MPSLPSSIEKNLFRRGCNFFQFDVSLFPTLTHSVQWYKVPQNSRNRSLTGYMFLDEPEGKEGMVCLNWDNDPRYSFWVDDEDVLHIEHSL